MLNVIIKPKRTFMSSRGLMENHFGLVPCNTAKPPGLQSRVTCLGYPLLRYDIAPSHFSVYHPIMACIQQHHFQPPVPQNNDPGGPSNGEVIAVLKTLPQDGLFAVADDKQKREFLRQLYVPLRRLFSTTTTRSNANHDRVKSVDHLEVLPTLHDRFPRFEENPFEFWERLIESLPRYSEQTDRSRAKTFL